MYAETWLKIVCDKCGSINWITNGDVSDQTVADVQGFNCWNCDKSHHFCEDDDDCNTQDDCYEQGLKNPN